MKKKIFKYICFILIFCVLLTGVINFFKLSDASTFICMKGFSYEKENELDVVLLGQSEVYSGFIPTLAWEEQGFTSFDYGLSGMPANIFLPALDEIEKKQKPKVLVVEITPFARKDEYFERYGKMHTWIDNLPITKARFDCIDKYVPEEKREEFYKPISTYHNNWKMVARCASFARTKILTIVNQHTKMKGFNVLSTQMGEKAKIDKNFTFCEGGEDYLYDFIDKCKEYGIENVLFVRIPHARTIKDKDAVTKIENIVTAAGYDFIDYNEDYDSFGINPLTDFANNDHFNVFGAEKFTREFSKLLVEKYNLKPEHDEDCINRWNEDSKYADEIIEYGRQQTKDMTTRRIYEYVVR